MDYLLENYACPPILKNNPGIKAILESFEPKVVPRNLQMNLQIGIRMLQSLKMIMHGDSSK